MHTNVHTHALLQALRIYGWHAYYGGYESAHACIDACINTYVYPCIYIHACITHT